MEILDKYNDWVVLNKTPFRKNGRLFLHCVCKCGKEQDVYYFNIINNKTLRCKSCSGKQNKLPEGFINSWKGKVIGALNRTKFLHMKQKAYCRNLEFSVTQQFLADLFEKQNRKCALSGLDITLSLKIKNGNPNFDFITASLDRIDSSKGYTEENVQWIHKDINKMKMAYPNEYFINMCKLIAKHNEKVVLV